MKVVLELPQTTSAVLERWARRNGLELHEHLAELVREDVRVIVRSIDNAAFDDVLGLDSVTVAVASEMGGEELGKYAPFLKVMGIEQGRIDIRDDKLDRIAEVTFRNESWFCDVDNKDSCVHVGFALAVRETMLFLQTGDGY